MMLMTMGSPVSGIVGTGDLLSVSRCGENVSGDGIVDVVGKAVSGTSGAAERHDRAVAEA